MSAMIRVTVVLLTLALAGIPHYFLPSSRNSVTPSYGSR